MDFETQLNGFLVGAQEVINTHYREQYPISPVPVLYVQRGSRYVRILRKTHPVHESGSAWAFIDITNGDILKPASWKTPAKHARGTIMEEGFGVKYVGPNGPHYLK